MEIFRKFRTQQFRFSRWLLYTWIKPTVLGSDAESLGLEPNDLICFALPHRSSADLMVVDMSCRQSNLPQPTSSIPNTDQDRAFFFLGHTEGALGRKTLRKHSPKMQSLLEQQALQTRTIKIIPVSLFWGHQPDRDKSAFKLLLSENWSATSGVKKLLAIIFHPGHILVQFGKPIHLDELIATESESERQMRKLHRLLRVHFNNQRQAIIGPNLSHRGTLINTILDSKDVRFAIERESRTAESDPIKIRKKAMKYAREIASDQSYRVIRLFDVLLTWLWNNLYNGIEVHGVDQVKQLAQSHEIVYTPCHRSHIDYLLLSYVLYHNGLTPPHIAAGKNLNLPIIGGFLRRAGAFYMRRTFHGDALYKAVFDEYLHQMFTKGYSVEYFIEGGRSRTGRTLNPRTGMLTMTVNSFQKDSTKNIAFLPVYFGYDRVLESSTYIAELAGRDKKTESMFDVFKVFSSFKHDFGQVSVNFGEPVLLREFLDASMGDWDQPGASNAELSAVCTKLSRDLATKINSAVAVKPTNLLSVALLSTARQNIDQGHLENQVALLQNIATRVGFRDQTTSLGSPAEIVEQAIGILGLQKSQRQFGTIVSASPVQSINMTYSANNVIHVFALPSLAARFVRTHHEVDTQDLLDFAAKLFPFLKAELFLPWQPAESDQILERVIDALIDVEVMHRFGTRLIAPTPDSKAYVGLKDVASISDPILERFYIVLALLQRVSEPTLKSLENASSGIAEQISALYGINSPDFFEKSLFASFLGALKTDGLINPELSPAASFAQLEEAVSQTLDPDIRYNIMQAVSNKST